MLQKSESTVVTPAESTQNRFNNHRGMDFLLLVRYLILRAAGILLTLIAGTFIVVVVMNQDGFIDQSVIKDAHEAAQNYLFEHPEEDTFTTREERNKFIEELGNQIADLQGVNLPYWPRQLRWTWNMLTFNWGDVKGILSTDKGTFVTFRVRDSNISSNLRLNARQIVAQHFPNTLLLVGTAYFLIFTFGLPLALKLSRRYNSWPDRLITALAPLSSIPSWAYGILLVSIFAFQLHWLPSGGKYDLLPPEDQSWWGYAPIVARHMVLPVAAIVLSMFFQVAYIWRTYFMLYTQEDYVELAIAKGLSPRTIEYQYILRPALPYILTNFVLMLAGFWQMTTAMEYFFNWPGIGWMYFRSLLMDDLIVSLGVVVIFAYLLGGIVLLLDLAYLILDPRIRFNVISQAAWQARIIPAKGMTNRNRIKLRLGLPRIAPREGWHRISEWYALSIRPLLIELRGYPSAQVGFIVILIFILASAYAMVVYPYNELETIWNPRLSQHITLPAIARPIWFNWFRVHDLPENQIIDSRIDTSLKRVKSIQDDGKNLSITYTFSVPDGDFPQGVVLYFYTTQEQKNPFVTATWITPDGREFKLNNKKAVSETSYDLSENIPNRYLDKRFRKQTLTTISGGEAPYKILFADPNSETLKPLAGTYQLRLDVITFEPASNFDAELVIFGQVYGWAGTDYLRRELSVGLLWGMPVALSIGMLGALTTSIFAMLIAAVSAWVGGWVDGLIQRITEGNMMLPVLAIGVLLAKYFHISIWAVLTIAILLNAFGGTTRSYRAAFLQVKETPYIEAARAYGATDLRIITHYMIPRIFPVMIPQVVMLVPGYVFLEATLAIFRVSTPYAPTWGRIIYDALTHGVLYGNYFWILEPITLLLITSLAFAMLGFTLDQVLNPRLFSTAPGLPNSSLTQTAKNKPQQRNRKLTFGIVLLILLLLLSVTYTQKNTFAEIFIDNSNEPQLPNGATNSNVDNSTNTPASSPTFAPASTPQPLATLTPSLPTETSFPSTPTIFVPEATPSTFAIPTRPSTYVLQRGEYLYCIARRFNLDPVELLVLNNFSKDQTLYTGTIILLPQNGHTFPGKRMLQEHPNTYTISRADETLYSISCIFGDLDPATIAEANQITIDTPLTIGQILNIP